MFEQLLDSSNFRVISCEFRIDPPTFAEPINWAAIDGMQTPFGHCSGQRIPNSIDPEFASYVRLTLFIHRCKSSRCCTRDEFDFAAVARFENDFIDVCHELGRSPVHFGHSQRATFFGHCCICKARGESDGSDCAKCLEFQRSSLPGHISF